MEKWYRVRYSATYEGEAVIPAVSPEEARELIEVGVAVAADTINCDLVHVEVFGVEEDTDSDGDLHTTTPDDIA